VSSHQGPRSAPEPKGRTIFTEDEIADLRDLIREKQAIEPSRQKAVRDKMRGLGFFISDFPRVERAFTEEDLDNLIESGVLRVTQHSPRGSELQEDDFPEERGLEPLPAGARKTVTVNRYERSPEARAQCVGHWGCDCVVCGFSFEETYGEIGHGYIHVHHLVPVSEVPEDHEVDPAVDLVPVCPNCHAMLHRRSPPFTVDEMQSRLAPR
jgi:predicted HNH restriction endonuclease